MDVVHLRDELGLSWNEIAIRTRQHKEAARSEYRRVKGTHVKDRGPQQERTVGTQQAQYEECGNDAVASVKDEVVHTLEQLLALCEVDTDTWDVDHYLVNSWGQNSTDGYTTLYQVKAWLKRKVPIVTEWPIVEPVQWSCKSYQASAVDHTLGLALVIPDSQTGFWRDFESGELNPFHDRRAIDITVRVARDLQPDTIVFLGDDLDLPDWTTKFSRSPEFYWTTQPAIVERAWWLSQYRAACPRARMVWLEGNHDQRLPNFISDNAVASYNLKPAHDLDRPPMMSIPYLLGLEELGIEWVGDYPNGRHWINDNLVCEHGDKVRSGSGKTVAAVVNDIRHSVIFGHIHRVEMASKTAFPRKGDRTYVAISPGTVARVDGAVPPQKKRTNWQQGFCIVSYDDEIFSQELVNIYGGKAIANGTLYKGESRVRDINRDTDNRFRF